MGNVEIAILSIMLFLLFSNFLLPKRILVHRWITYFLIPVTLLFLWIGLIIYQSFIIENVFTILTDSYSLKRLSYPPLTELTQGKIITGKFEASQNHLGIIGVRFWNFYRLNADQLIFRIRDINDQNWYYENIYKADQLQPHQFFTFGFPVIDASLDHQYEFQIESASGSAGNAVGLSSVDPGFIVKYKYSRTFVTSSITNFLNFCFIKLQNLITYSYFTASSYVFFLPFLLYLIFISGWGKYLVPQKSLIYRIFGLKNKFTKRNVSICLSVFGLVADILFINTGNLTIVILLAVLIYLISTYKFKFQLIFLLGICCLVISAGLLYMQLPSQSERAGAWAWIFLFIWLTLQLWQSRPLKS